MTDLKIFGGQCQFCLGSASDEKRIDGIVASLMALGRVIQADEARGSVYDSGTFTFL
ncbi:hypothetical protein [Massilia sp. TWR1-2-2]|uniref:hypothetical protein n=1 Tax=Massilia sp. TWR1-2-2 TaxID=2804584 RepID=UPI003CEB86D6